MAVDLSAVDHPRLWMGTQEQARVKRQLASDPLAARMQAQSLAGAKQVLTARTCRYEIADGKRLLPESRLAMQNIIHTAWAWRMDGDEAYRVRAIAEMDAACAMKDWNPSHFLDTAEMAAAVAIGYDWLHATLTPAQRQTYEQAIVEKALKPAKEIYDKRVWWAKPGNNWSQVCGSGIALAAMAVAGHDQGVSSELIDRGVELVSRCVKFYQPDGMYPEGPGYWQYGTNYHVMLLAACQKLGIPMADDPVMKMAGDSIMHLVSPSGLAYNFADGGAGHDMPSPAQCWLAGHYHDPLQLEHVRNGLTNGVERSGPKKGFAGDRWFPLAILWLPPVANGLADAPGAAVFHGEQAMAIFRSGWKTQAAWLAIKGGTPAASHGHMDVGSFCYDVHGMRWIEDLGSENYNLPAYFGNRRWTYFRLQNASHNTLQIDGKLQDPKCKPCPVIDSVIKGGVFSATIDLTAAYAETAEKVVRSARFDAQTGKLTLVDEIQKPSGNVVWRAYTDAQITVHGNSVVLSKKGEKITVVDVSNKGEWTVGDATPPTAVENQNKGFRALVLTIPKEQNIHLVVEIQP